MSVEMGMRNERLRHSRGRQHGGYHRKDTVSIHTTQAPLNSRRSISPRHADRLVASTAIPDALMH